MRVFVLFIAMALAMSANSTTKESDEYRVATENLEGCLDKADSVQAESVEAEKKKPTKIIVEQDRFYTLLVEKDPFYIRSAGDPISPASINVFYEVDENGAGTLAIEPKIESATIGKITIVTEAGAYVLGSPAPKVCFVEALESVSMEFKDVNYRWEIPLNLVCQTNYKISFYKPTCSQYK